MQSEVHTEAMVHGITICNFTKLKVYPVTNTFDCNNRNLVGLHLGLSNLSQIRFQIKIVTKGSNTRWKFLYLFVSTI